MLSFFASRSTWSLWSRVLPGFTGFYRVFLGFTGFYRVFVDLIASRQRRRTRCCEAACHTTRCNAALVTSVYWSAETKERERERGAPGIADDDVGDDDDDVVDRRRGPPNSRSFPTRNLMDAAGHLFYHSLDAINLLKLCRNPAGQSSDLGGNDS